MANTTKYRLLLISAFAAALSIVSLPFINDKVWSWKSSLVADLVVTNALIYTSDSSSPFAQAMAIKSGRILRVGNYSSFRDLIGKKTQVMNVKGKVIVPGFIDSHVHLIYGGLQMAQVELHGVKSRSELVRKIEIAVQDKPQGTWLLGGGWNNDLWGGDLPTSSWIDDITPNNPVWLSRMDGHMGLANTHALNLSGITNQTIDPIGGIIVRDNNGEPTGLLVDSAMQLLRSWIPEPSVHERRDAVLRSSKYALMKGVTTLVDMGRYVPGVSSQLPWDDLSDIYLWADSMGRMLIRVCLFFPMETWTRVAEIWKQRGRKLSEWVYLGGVKAFSDGSLGSNSALFHEPYLEEHANYGLILTDYDWLLNTTLAVDKEGLQVAIHAIGDKANDMILDLYDVVNSLNGMRERRFRIEHAQHVIPESVARFGQLKVIASVQPVHLLDDGDSALKKLGIIRAQTESYLFKSILNSNTQLAFGSDWPVADINPLANIQTAMKRMPRNWKTAWILSECLTLNDAVDAHTISAAYANFLDKDLGSLSPGKLADFVILSSNSWEEIGEDESVHVLETYVNGLKAYPFDTKNEGKHR